MTSDLSDLVKHGVPDAPQMHGLAGGVVIAAQRVRRRRRTAAAAVGAICVFGIAVTPVVLEDDREVSPQGPPVPVSQSAEETPLALTCPSGNLMEAPSGFSPEVEQGFDTPEAAVEDWLRGRDQAGASFEIGPGAYAAYLMRPDGTAFARLSFLAGSNDFLVDSVLSCVE